MKIGREPDRNNDFYLSFPENFSVFLAPTLLIRWPGWWSFSRVENMLPMRWFWVKTKKKYYKMSTVKKLWQTLGIIRGINDVFVIILVAFYALRIFFILHLPLKINLLKCLPLLGKIESFTLPSFIYLLYHSLGLNSTSLSLFWSLPDDNYCSCPGVVRV